MSVIFPGGEDIVFACTGLPQCIDFAIELCKKHGAFVWQGKCGALPIDMISAQPSPCHSFVITRESRMPTILITGASGFIGNALAKSLSTPSNSLAQAIPKSHKVLALSRKIPNHDPSPNLTWIKGDFASFEDLRQLDNHKIDALIHLAAVAGGCSERDALLVNVEGTRVLLRYLIDRNTKKFVLASSVAAVGAQDPNFRPQQIPIPDNHPCLDLHGYGLSKYLMEELTKYYARQNPTLDIINLRLAAIVPNESPPDPGTLRPIHEWAACSLAIMLLSDALTALTLAVESPQKPGVRILNATSPKAWLAIPTGTLLRHWWGNSPDLSYFDRPENKYASLFDVSKIREELHFTAQYLPRQP